MTNKDKGYIKLYRSLEQKGYYKRPEYVALWVHLLMRASYQQTEYLFNGEIHHLEPGQFITGRKALSKETGISQTTCERILNCFESEQQIGQQKNNKFRIITILNWSEYQVSGQQNGQQMDNKRTTNGHLADTINKERNKERKNKIYTSDSDEIRLSQFLFQKMKENNPGVKEPNFQTWAIYVDRMLRIDNRTPQEIEAVISWAQQDNFWKLNILSAQKLREKYDQLNTKRLASATNDTPWYARSNNG